MMSADNNRLCEASYKMLRSFAGYSHGPIRLGYSWAG